MGIATTHNNDKKKKTGRKDRTKRVMLMKKNPKNMLIIRDYEEHLFKKTKNKVGI